MMLCLDSAAKNKYLTATDISCEKKDIPALALSGQPSLDGPLIKTCST